MKKLILPMILLFSTGLAYAKPTHIKITGWQLSDDISAIAYQINTQKCEGQKPNRRCIPNIWGAEGTPAGFAPVVAYGLNFQDLDPTYHNTLKFGFVENGQVQYPESCKIDVNAYPYDNALVHMSLAGCVITH